MNRIVLALSVLLTIGACTTASTKPETSPRESTRISLNEMIERGDPKAYEDVESRFIAAAKNGNRQEMLSLLSPLSKRDSKKSETEVFMTNTINYFSDYKATQGCQSAVATHDEYKNLGYMYYGAFITTSGSGKPYVMALIRENNQVYVSIVFGRLDKQYHARCKF